MRINKLALLVGSAGSVSSLAAQYGLNCPSGPGSAFGIVAYQCANCGFKQESGQRPSYTFFAEPVVTQVDRPAAFASTRPVIVIDGVVQGSPAVGDVIEAVDGHPITTQAGADLFAYPAPGSHSLTVRRGRERQVLGFAVPASCDTRAARIRGTPALGGFRARGDSLRYLGDTVYIRGDSVYRGSGSDGAALAATVSTIIDGIHRGSGSGAGSGYGRGVPVIGGVPVEVTGGSSGAVTTTGSSPTAGKFGFAVECRPSCSMRRRPNGEYYYKYDGYPRIIEVREHSAADRAGLRVGDLITKVEGRSILAEDALSDLDQRDQLHMTVQRDGKDINVVMLVVR
ncbi:MAG TPA: PDZ domain-containing protein [Gemmatimonadaceae bacterium]